MEDFEDRFMRTYDEIDTGFILRACEDVTGYIWETILSENEEAKSIKLVPL